MTTKPAQFTLTLTRQQIAVLDHCAHGRSAQETAEIMGLSEGTIRGHLRTAATRFDGRWRPGQVHAAISAELITLGDTPEPAWPPALNALPDYRTTWAALALSHDANEFTRALGQRRPAAMRALSDLETAAGATSPAHLVWLGHRWHVLDPDTVLT